MEQSPSQTSTKNQRRYEALLTGLPYAVFKIQAGWYLSSILGYSLGYLLLTVGVIDIVLNLVGLLKPAPFPLCSLVVISRSIGGRQHPRRYDEVGLALDTLLSFFLVSAMIWFGAIGALTPKFGRLWDVSVILNIVSVGVARVYASFRRPGSP